MQNPKFENLKDGQEILFESLVNGVWMFVPGVVKVTASEWGLSNKLFYRKYKSYLSPVGKYILPHRMDEVKLINQ